MRGNYVGSQVVPQTKLKPDDFKVMFFDRNVVKRHERIILKDKGEVNLSHDEFIQRWKERVHVSSKVEFIKEKLVIHLYDGMVALVFNSCLLETIRFTEVIFGSGSYWANNTYLLKNDTCTSDVWSVDIYKDELASTVVSKVAHFNYELYPRQYTIPKLLTALNKRLTQFLKRKTNSIEAVRFSLSDHFTKLELSPHVTLTLSPNLVSMLGFEQDTFTESTYLSSILPTTLDNREQEIFIYLDIVDPMSYGSEKRQMIQHFIHNKEAS